MTCNEHGMIIFDQNVNRNDRRRNLSLQKGIWKFNRRNPTIPHMKYNENSVKLNGKTYTTLVSFFLEFSQAYGHICSWFDSHIKRSL